MGMRKSMSFFFDVEGEHAHAKKHEHQRLLTSMQSMR